MGEMTRGLEDVTINRNRVKGIGKVCHFYEELRWSCGCVKG